MPALTLASLLERYLVLGTAMPRVATSEHDRLHIYSQWFVRSDYYGHLKNGVNADLMAPTSPPDS